MRFSPPPAPVSPEVRWLLRRAFGPTDRAAGIRPGPAAVDAARRLGLASRLVHRNSPDTLAAELGRGPAGELQAEALEAAVLAGQLAVVARRVAGVATRCSLPIVLLKGSALEAGGHVPPGSREASDVDVLAERREAPELFDGLVADGFRPLDEPGHEHQLRPLAHPAGLSVEIHTMILGVRLAGRRSAELGDLGALGLLREAQGFPAFTLVPDRRALAAHALVHGIAQHGAGPHRYPLLRMVADLVDLGWPERTDFPAEWTRGAVSEGERREAESLCRALSSGDDAPLDDPAAPGGRLLRHVLAAAFDPAYGPGLARTRLRHPLTDRGRVRQFLSVARGALWPTRWQMQVAHGPRSPLARAALRVRRPFTLLARVLR